MNKNILITGGSQGIGKNIADTLSVNSDYNVYASNTKQCVHNQHLATEISLWKDLETIY